MPPKRRSTGPAAKSQQSTLAFHGASNKVIKPGARAADAKKNLLSKQVKDEEPVVQDVKIEEEIEEPTTAEATIIEQAEQVQEAQPTPEEEEARRVTAKQIEAYWKKQVAENGAPRAHQEDLSLEEKVLRKFDMSGQYGVRMPAHFRSRMAGAVRDAPGCACLAMMRHFGSPQAASSRTDPHCSPVLASPG